MTLDQLDAHEAEFTPRAWRRGARNMRVMLLGQLRRVRSWRLHLAVPGLAGGALVSAGLGGLAGHIWPGTGTWVLLGALGAFALRIDSRTG
jgi:hypothetical protein